MKAKKRQTGGPVPPTRGRIATQPMRKTVAKKKRIVRPTQAPMMAPPPQGAPAYKRGGKAKRKVCCHGGRAKRGK